MNTKLVLGILAVLVVVGGGYWYWQNSSAWGSYTKSSAGEPIQHYLKDLPNGKEGVVPKESGTFVDGYFHQGNLVYFNVVRTGYPNNPPIGENLVAGADLETFVLLPDVYGPGNYAKDKSGVYFRGVVITGADPATFQLKPYSVNATSDAQDKNHEYYEGKIVQ